MGVTIYSTPTCAFCKMAKGYLHANNVPFTEVDVSTSQEGLKWIIDRTGQAGVPVIEIGQQIILGFDRPNIDAALHKLNKN